MRTVSAFDDRVYKKAGNDGAIGIAGDDLGRHNFFGNNDYPLSSAHALDHDAEISPAVSVAFRISPLNMNNCHIGVQGPNSPQRFLGRKRRKYLIEKMITLCSIRSQSCLSR